MKPEFYKGRRVLITGHTGFKGAWMSLALLMAGARVTGYALQPPTDPSLFALLRLERDMDSRIGDVRDFDAMKRVFAEVQPEIVIHMAAQPIVREGYSSPVYTYHVNCMGTVHALECVRLTPSVRSFVNVTTDKVYRNRAWEWGYREDDELGGGDPYAGSKSCSELITMSYRQSFFQDRDCGISAMRAGNVIGGGDFAADRIVPDCYRAAVRGENIVLRNPDSVRPYEHVLEPVMAYLMVAEAQARDRSKAGAYNVGPREDGVLCTGELAERFCRAWNRRLGASLSWTARADGGPHEDKYLRLDCARLRQTFGWKPVWDIREAMDRTVDIYAEIFTKGRVQDSMERQIAAYLSGSESENAAGAGSL